MAPYFIRLLQFMQDHLEIVLELPCRVDKPI